MIGPLQVFCIVLVVSFVLLQFTLGQVNRLLGRACGRSYLRIPIKNKPYHWNLRSRIAHNPISITSIILRWRLWINRRLINRRLIRRIHSDQLVRIVQDTFCSTLTNPLTIRRLRKYVTLRTSCDDDASLEVLNRWVQTATFSLVSPTRALTVGLSASLERRPGMPMQQRLVLGMELWMMLLQVWSTPRNTGGGARRIYDTLFSVGNPLRFVVRRLVTEGVTHEFVHILQEMNEQVLMREYNGADDPKELGFLDWVKYEWDAFYFGSRSWLYSLLVVVVIPLVFLAGMS